MATAITTSRQFRVGRVLHEPNGDFVLVNSPRPRIWQGIYVSALGSGYSLATLTSAHLRNAYSHYSLGVRNPLDATDASKVLKSAEFSFKVAPDYKTRRALMRKGSYAPNAAAAQVVASANTKNVAASTPKVQAAQKKRSSTFSTPDVPQNPYWYESDKDRKLTRDFIALRKSGFTVNLMIAGPSGSGKTVGVQHLGEELGYPVHIVNCQAITTPEKWIGQMMADPSKGTFFVPSQHLEWVERTHEDCANAEYCILLYDEITRLRPELNNMTYSLFDTQKGLEVPQMGRRVFMSDRNIIVSTANIGAAFSGTFGQDRAFRERFAMTMERDFPPSDEEVKILTSATGVSEDDARTLTAIAGATRDKWRNQIIEQPISTRTLVTWALLVSGGYDVMQGAEYTVLPLYSEDGGVDSDRAKVRLEIEAKSK